MQQRSILIDLLRTLAITLMIIYHAAYDLAMFHDWDIHVLDGGWKLLARASLILFLFVSGLSQAMSHQSKGPAIRWKRVAQVACSALMVSIATYVIDPSTFVQFGVLHLIAASMIILPFCARWKIWNVFLGMMMMIGISMFDISQFSIINDQFSIPLGFPPLGYQTVDYVPLIPWFGIILIGYGLGYAFGTDAMRWCLWGNTQDALSGRLYEGNPTWIHVITWPGRHSLLIYLLHQPILLTILFVLHP